ncbi:MAG TPA: class I SAM-dependent methyltransferase [Nonomuraea sp.]|nr:class I SAM-dependent methyltransferase [Nonomuraea sp.]
MTVSKPAEQNGQQQLSPLTPLPPSQAWDGPGDGQGLFQRYSTEEDQRRTNVHYEQPVEFFTTLTGGAWNTYSANLWHPGIETDTQSQEAKLDLLAEHMKLQPGMRVMDVGCGWGGPLAYVCKTYGVEGIGLTLSPKQKAFAEQRMASLGLADRVRIVESHWADFEGVEPGSVDAIFTDEVIVHFNDLGGFFEKAHGWLKAGGRMVNKELHFVHSSYKTLSRAATLIHEIYGLTGNYRMLSDELQLLDEAGFKQAVYTIPQWHYTRTAERWVQNMDDNRARLEEVVGAEYFRRFKTYVKIVRKMTVSESMTLDVVVGTKI